MRTTIHLGLLLGILLTTSQVTAQSIAVYRNDKQSNQSYIDVFVSASAEGQLTSLPVSIVKIVDDARVLVLQTVIGQDQITMIPDKGARFRVNLGSPLVPNAKYKLAIAPGGLRLIDANVSWGLSGEFFTEFGHQCDGAIALRLSGLPGDKEAGTERFWEPILTYLRNAEEKPNQFVRMSLSVDDHEHPLGLRSLSIRNTDAKGAADAGRVIVCLDPGNKLPEQPFSVAAIFQNDPPSALVGSPLPGSSQYGFVGNGLSGAESPSFAKASAKPGDPGDRPLERNLDLGVSFTSSIDQIPPEKGKEKDPPQFKRTNRGVLDLRLAPWLNLTSTTLPGPEQRWFKFWTPIYLDANVATGKIEKETISLNRVLIGSEFEFRLIDFHKNKTTSGVQTDTSRANDFYRFILRGNHASDRDFKQLEYTGSFEFQPVLTPFFKPLEANFHKVTNAISQKDEYKSGIFGVELLPKVGFSLGRTYARRDPAAAIQSSDTVKRFYTGLDLKLNFTSRVELNLTDTFFYRWELPSNRTKNYFKGELNLLMKRAFSRSTQGLFFSFERGNQPPFSNPDVNVFKVGYRIRSEGWFGRYR